MSQIDEYFDKIKSLNTHNRTTIVYGCLPKVIPDKYKENKSKDTYFIPSDKPEQIDSIMHELLADSKISGKISSEEFSAAKAVSFSEIEEPIWF